MQAPSTPWPSGHHERPATADVHDSPTHSAVSWWKAAYCRGADIGIFFPLPGDHATTQRALAVCDRCPVRIPCRRHALRRRERHGIWGGLTEETRATLIRIGPPPTAHIPSGAAAPVGEHLPPPER